MPSPCASPPGRWWGVAPWTGRASRPLHLPPPPKEGAFRFQRPLAPSADLLEERARVSDGWDRFRALIDSPSWVLEATRPRSPFWGKSLCAPVPHRRGAGLHPRAGVVPPGPYRGDGKGGSQTLAKPLRLALRPFWWELPRPGIDLRVRPLCYAFVLVLGIPPVSLPGASFLGAKGLPQPSARPRASRRRHPKFVPRGPPSQTSSAQPPGRRGPFLAPDCAFLQLQQVQARLTPIMAATWPARLSKRLRGLRKLRQNPLLDLRRSPALLPTLRIQHKADVKGLPQ